MEYRAFDNDEQRELTVNFVRSLLTDDLVVSSLARAITGSNGYEVYTKNLSELQGMSDRLVHMLVSSPSPELVDKLLVVSAPQLMHLVLCAYRAAEKGDDTLITRESLPDHGYILWLVCRRFTNSLFKITGELIGDYAQNLPKERTSFEQLRNYRMRSPIPPISRYKPSMLGNFPFDKPLQATAYNTAGFPTIDENLVEQTNYQRETIKDNTQVYQNEIPETIEQQLPNYDREEDAQD